MTDPLTCELTSRTLPSFDLGNEIELGGAVVVRYAGGKLIEEWEYVDTARVLAQFTQPQPPS